MTFGDDDLRAMEEQQEQLAAALGGVKLTEAGARVLELEAEVARLRERLDMIEPTHVIHENSGVSFTREEWGGGFAGRYQREEIAVEYTHVRAVGTSWRVWSKAQAAWRLVETKAEADAILLEQTAVDA